MKKFSTILAKQSRKSSQRELIVGLDLGDRNSWYCVLDEAGHIQLEQRVRTTVKALGEVFSGMPSSRVALETGTHSPWISRLLRELGHEVIVANARKVRLIGESRKKDDRLDAQTLARLARIDPELLCPVKHRSAQAQADLMMIRARAGLVRVRTGLVNTACGPAKSYGERLRGCNVRNMNPEKAEGLSAELQAAAEAGQGSRYADRADVSTDAGRPAAVLEESRRGRLSRTAARAEEIRTKRATAAHQQGRRPIPAHAAGTRSATYLETVWS